MARQVGNGLAEAGPVIPPDPTPEQRARDGRLAWIIVGCCAALTVFLLVAGAVALRGPMARWTAEMAASSGNRQALTEDAGNADADANEQESDLARDNAADLPSIGREVRKQDVSQRGDSRSDDATVRRGEGPHNEGESRRPAGHGPTA